MAATGLFRDEDQGAMEIAETAGQTRRLQCRRFLGDGAVEGNKAAAIESQRIIEVLFGEGDEYLQRPRSSGTSRSWFMRALANAGLPRMTVHDLRHTAASLAIASGANVKAVQRMLGHASAAMTLDVYADLFDDDVDAVSAALDQARTTAIVSKPRPLAHSDAD